jgi:hypothetical protein
MQAVVKLALECPFELGVIEVAGVEIEVIGMDGDVWVFEFYDDLNCLPFSTGVEIQKRMLVETELG